jgi:hypothetical protein
MGEIKEGGKGNKETKERKNGGLRDEDMNEITRILSERQNLDTR